MPISGYLVNAQDKTLVLGIRKDGAVEIVEGQTYEKDNQKQLWNAHYTSEEPFQCTLQNSDSGHYLGADSSMKPIMNTKVYWWNAIRTGINVGFQVPGGLGSYTVELEDDKSVKLANQSGKLIERQLWTPTDQILAEDE